MSELKQFLLFLISHKTSVSLFIRYRPDIIIRIVLRYNLVLNVVSFDWTMRSWCLLVLDTASWIRAAKKKAGGSGDWLCAVSASPQPSSWPPAPLSIVSAGSGLSVLTPESGDKKVRERVRRTLSW